MLLAELAWCALPVIRTGGLDIDPAEFHLVDPSLVDVRAPEVYPIAAIDPERKLVALGNPPYDNSGLPLPTPPTWDWAIWDLEADRVLLAGKLGGETDATFRYDPIRRRVVALFRSEDLDGRFPPPSIWDRPFRLEGSLVVGFDLDSGVETSRLLVPGMTSLTSASPDGKAAGVARALVLGLLPTDWHCPIVVDLDSGKARREKVLADDACLAGDDRLLVSVPQGVFFRDTARHRTLEHQPCEPPGEPPLGEGEVRFMSNAGLFRTAEGTILVMSHRELFARDSWESRDGSAWLGTLRQGATKVIWSATDVDSWMGGEVGVYPEDPEELLDATAEGRLLLTSHCANGVSDSWSARLRLPRKCWAGFPNMCSPAIVFVSGSRMLSERAENCFESPGLLFLDVSDAAFHSNPALILLYERCIQASHVSRIP